MILKVYEVLQGVTTLMKIRKREDLSTKGRYWVNRIIEKLGTEYNTIIKSSKDVYEKHAKKDENGNFIMIQQDVKTVDNNGQEIIKKISTGKYDFSMLTEEEDRLLNEEWNEFSQQTIEVDCPKISIDLLENLNPSLSETDIMYIYKFLQD